MSDGSDQFSICPIYMQQTKPSQVISVQSGPCMESHMCNGAYINISCDAKCLMYAPFTCEIQCKKPMNVKACEVYHLITLSILCRTQISNTVRRMLQIRIDLRFIETSSIRVSGITSLSQAFYHLVSIVLYIIRFWIRWPICMIRDHTEQDVDLQTSREPYRKVTLR